MAGVTVDKKVKGRTTGVYVDLPKFFKLVDKANSQKEFAETIGRSSAWVWNVQQTGLMAKSDALAIKAVYKVDIIAPEPVEEEEKPQTVVQQNNEDVLKKLDEILVAVNRLGNVNMQMLEDLHKITKELVK